METTNLIPARFLTLVAHFIIIVTVLWTREENVKACLPWTYSEDEYKSKDNQLITGLSLALVLLTIELISFLAGISMFLPTQALISIAAHSSAAISLFYFLTDGWDCDVYWWIFGFCSALPALTEIIVIIGVLGLKKTL